MICQLPSCNLFTQHVCLLFYGETPLVKLWPPVHSFTLITTSFTCFSSSFDCWSVCFHHHFPHHTFNSLVNSKTGRLTTFLESWGQREVCVLCVGPRLSTANFWRLAEGIGVLLD